MTGRPTMALAALLLGLAAVMAVWLSIDRRPPEWGRANHLEHAVLCQRSLAEPAREALLVGWIVRNFDPTPRLRRLPMAVSVNPISITARRLEVGLDPDPLCRPKESR